MIWDKEICIYRLIEKEDIKRYFEWQEEGIDYYPYTPSRVLEEELEAEFRALFYQRYIFIIKTNKNVPIGYCCLGDIQYKNANGKIRAVICEEKYRKKGYYIDAYATIFHYLFSVFNLHKIYELVYEFEKEKIEALEKIGIKRIAIIPEDFFHKNRFWNVYLYNIFAKEYYDGLFQK